MERVSVSVGVKVTMIDGAFSFHSPTSNTLHIPWVYVPLVSAAVGETNWRYVSSLPYYMALHTDVPLRPPQDPETSRLLSDDPFRNYGSRAQPTRRPLDEPDPEYVRQEREALETIALSMSE